jgi:hypothetical protein
VSWSQIMLQRLGAPVRHRRRGCRLFERLGGDQPLGKPASKDRCRRVTVRAGERRERQPPRARPERGHPGCSRNTAPPDRLASPGAHFSVSCTSVVWPAECASMNRDGTATRTAPRPSLRPRSRPGTRRSLTGSGLAGALDHLAGEVVLLVDQSVGHLQRRADDLLPSGRTLAVRG